MQDEQTEGAESGDDSGPFDPATIALVLADLDASTRRFQHWLREQNRRAADRRAMNSPMVALRAARPAHPSLN
jgi:hypothetical protein